MGIKEICGLVPTQKVYHKHYGLCTVKEINRTGGGEIFGLVIIPDILAGQLLLQAQSGMPKGTPLLETQYRYLSSVETKDGFHHIKIKA